jgi:hypothetical protein
VSVKVESLSTGITCKTFCDRLYKCYYFKEKESYLKNVGLLFNKVLVEYRLRKAPILTTFAEQLSSRSFTGPRRIEATEREEFRKICTSCAINLSNLFDKYEVTDILDNYVFKWKIKGSISGILHAAKDYNLQLSYENASLVQKDLDFFSINSYIYNVTHGLKNDTLVMSVPTNTFFLVPYEERDYTIKRGFLTITKGNRLRLRGEHCLQCECKCNPHWINGLDRLTAII